MPEHIIEMAVIELIIDIALEWRQLVIITHEAMLIEIG
jgi:hypothetical protein